VVVEILRCKILIFWCVLGLPTRLHYLLAYYVRYSSFIPKNSVFRPIFNCLDAPEPKPALKATQSNFLPPCLFKNHSPRLRIFVIALCVINISSLALRLWSRMLTNAGSRRTPKLWWDHRVAMLTLAGTLQRSSSILFAK